MKVFKYRGGSWDILKRDLKSLSKNQIFSAPIDALNDPFEAKVQFHGKNFELGRILKDVPFFEYNNSVKDAEVKFIKVLSDFVHLSKTWGIYSLSKTYNDELLWAYYADSHRGFCIEYDLDKLKEYEIHTEPTINVSYEKNMPVVKLSDLSGIEQQSESLTKKLVGTKSKKWFHEREVRIVTGKPGLFDYDFRAVKAIYFGYRSDERLRKLTMRLLRGRSIKYYLVKPENNSYKLNREELNDYYVQHPQYMQSIAPVQEGIPYIDETLKPYEDLINCAIEIVRREPYCAEVLDAYLSGSKGTKTDPVFYVTYDRTDGRTKNYFISKSEIEAACV